MNREAVGRLLADVAESEHQLRHPDAFAELCAAVKFEVVKEPHRVTVRDTKSKKGGAKK